jgi:peptidoglycan/LPS O-acetylase OafA/YrhL
MPRESPDVDATRARLDVGDPLRALTALGVVFVHVIAVSVSRTGYAAELQSAPRQYFAALFGPVGHVFNGLLPSVSVFFVLSGYLLMRPFARAYLADDPFPSIVGYLRNRALRVLPAFWFVLLAAVVLEGARGDSWTDVLALAAFAGDFHGAGFARFVGPCWSLAVEVRFYLLLPLAGLLLIGLGRCLGERMTLAPKIAAAIVLLAAVRVASTAHATRVGYGAGFGANVQYIVPGMLLAVLEHAVPRHVRGSRWAAIAACGLFAGGIVLLLASRAVQFALDGGAWFSAVVWIACGAIVGGPLLWQWSGRAAWRILDNRPLHWIGERAYPLFLVHMLVLLSLAPLLATGGYVRTPLVLGPAGFAVSLLVADLIHRWIELPALRRKRDYAGGSSWSTTVAPLPAATSSKQARAPARA